MGKLGRGVKVPMPINVETNWGRRPRGPYPKKKQRMGDAFGPYESPLFGGRSPRNLLKILF